MRNFIIITFGIIWGFLMGKLIYQNKDDSGLYETTKAMINNNDEMGSIRFMLPDQMEPVVELKPAGIFLVNGVEIADNKELYEGYKKFINKACCQCGKPK